MIDVSVIIPTYNRLWALPAAIESCRGDRCRTEILVVDDGSTDGTWEWLQTQKEVVALRQDNWGKDWAVNKAFALSTGEFVRFLDSDDWLLPGANDAQLGLARSRAADVVVAGYSRFDESTGAQEAVSWQECDDFIAQQLGECSSSHYSAYLIRRSFIAGIPHRQEFGARDDRMFVIELAIHDPKTAAWDAPTFVHRQHRHERLQSPTESKAITINRELLAVYRQALRLLEDHGQLTIRRKRAAINVLWPLAHWIAYADLDQALQVVNWIEQLDPDFRPPETGLLGALYRNLGFALTEQILRTRRALLRTVGNNQNSLAESRKGAPGNPTTIHTPVSGEPRPLM